MNVPLRRREGPIPRSAARSRVVHALREDASPVVGRRTQRCKPRCMDFSPSEVAPGSQAARPTDTSATSTNCRLPLAQGFRFNMTAPFCHDGHGADLGQQYFLTGCLQSLPPARQAARARWNLRLAAGEPPLSTVLLFLSSLLCDIYNKQSASLRHWVP